MGRYEDRAECVDNAGERILVDRLLEIGHLRRVVIGNEQADERREEHDLIDDEQPHAKLAVVHAGQ